MSLRVFVDRLATNRRTLTVYAPEPDEALAEHFEARGVTVDHERLPDDGSGGFVVVTAEEEFVGSIPGGSPADSSRPTRPTCTPGRPRRSDCR